MTRQNPRTVADIFHNEATAWGVLAVSLVITFLAAYITNEYIQRRAEERFAFEVQDARERIAKRMQEYEQALRGGVGLFETLDGEVSREQWRRYVAMLQIGVFYPGIQGIGYAQMLRPDELAGHTAARRAEGFADYAVSPAGERELYSAITFLEPFDARNRRAFGYDMFSEPVRRAAMEQARDSGLPAVSGRVTLMQEDGEDLQAGFLMYLPVYRPGLPTDTVAQRRAALQGFVYSPFRIKDLMHGILGSDTPDLGFELFNGDSPLAEQYLYSSEPTHDSESQTFITTSTIPLPGRVWTARFHSHPAFERSVDSMQPLLIGLGGTTVDLLLFAIIWSLAGERKRVEQKAAAMTAELRSSALLLQSIIDTIPDLVVLKDADLVYQNVNAAFLRFVGKPREAIIGQTDYTLFPKAEAEQYRNDDQRILATGQPLTVVEHVTGVEGQRWLQVAKVPLLDAEGAIRGVLMSVRDISALQNAKEDLRRKHAELEAVFATDHVLIAVLDREFRFLQVNAAYAAAAGHVAAEMIGKRHFELFPQTETEVIFRHVVATGQTFSTHAKPFDGLERPDTQRYWDWTLSPLYGEEGVVEGVTLTLIDATERERNRQEAEEAWRSARAELEQRVLERTRDLEIAYRELETFSYSVSHDLQGPLRAIDGYTQILAEDYQEALDQTGRSYIARVHGATLRMAALIDGLLDLSRLFRSEVLPARVDLSACAAEIIQLLASGEPGRQLAVEIEPGLTAFGDPILLRVALQNLIENAWKFTARRADAVIEVGQVYEGGREVFFVRDNGIGFDAQYAHKLFQPFERLHPEHEFQGTGIGLATVRRIMQRHGGEVWAEGQAGQGATVYFTLQPPLVSPLHSIQAG